jgi:urea transport system permease protein
MALANPNPNVRRDASTKLGLEQNADYLEYFQARLGLEQNASVRKALTEALAITQLASSDGPTRVAAVRQLGAMRSVAALDLLKRIEAETKKDPAKQGPEMTKTVHLAVSLIENYMSWGNFLGTLFRGLSLSSVLLVAAIGLSITFGLMGIINMAHGEMIMLGAYAAYVTQNVFIKWFGPGTTGFDCYFLAALPFSFLSAGAVGSSTSGRSSRCWRPGG